MSTNEPIRFSRDFKLEALRRMETGENVSVLARELGVSRKSIYKWRDRYRLAAATRCVFGRKARSESSAAASSPASADPAIIGIGSDGRRARKRPRCARPFNAWHRH